MDPGEMHVGPPALGQLDDDVIRGGRLRDDRGPLAVQGMANGDFGAELSCKRLALLAFGESASAQVRPRIAEHRFLAHGTILR